MLTGQVKTQKVSTVFGQKELIGDFAENILEFK